MYILMKQTALPGRGRRLRGRREGGRDQGSILRIVLCYVILHLSY